MVNIRWTVLVVFLALAWTADADQVSDKYLLNFGDSESLQIIEVCIQPGGGQARTVLFNKEHGSADPAKSEVRGLDLLGEPVTLPFADVVWMKVEWPVAGIVKRATLRMDAVRDRANWSPRGPAIQLALLGGPIIEFEGIAPQLDAPAQEIVWLNATGDEVRLPLSQVFWIEHARNGTANSESGFYGAGRLASADLGSGQTVDLRELKMVLDLERGLVRGQDRELEIPLGELVTLSIDASPEVSFEQGELLVSLATASSKKLSPDQRIRIKVNSKDSRWITGNFKGFQDGEFLILTEGGSAVSVPEGDVFAVQTSEFRSAGILRISASGILLGAYGAGLAAIKGGPWGPGPTDEEIRDYVLVGMAVGAFLAMLAPKREHFVDLEGFKTPVAINTNGHELFAAYSFRF
jgi:hypothetical protein